MFTPEERSQLRSGLLEHAAADSRISSAAITGSAAAGCEDRWSDIDLAFGVADAAALPNVLADWTAHMYGEHSAVHHVDVHAGAWIYRVFLLPGTLQVDLAFVPAAEFRAMAPSFRLMFGKANQARQFPAPSTEGIAGMAWLYALHARTALARRNLWQAEYMISGVRDYALALACIRHGLPPVHARGIDQLPNEVTEPFKDSLVRQLDAADLSRAFRAAISGLLSEIERADADLAGRVTEPLRELTEIHAAGA
jgi:hypothetical protein